MNYRNIFCENLKFLRASHKLTKKEMAEKCRTSVYNICLPEKGIIPPRLSADILFDISREFGIQPQYMFDKLYLS